MASHLLIIAVLTATLISMTDCHGYMIQPPGRSSAWRKGFKTPINNDDNGLYCGGFKVQYENNGGKCGVCGDDFNSNRPNEPGPGNRYATGTIVAQYKQGDTVEITINLSTYHKGYYEFRLCQNNVPQKGHDARSAVSQSCFDKNLLRSPSGQTRFTASQGISKHLVQLPGHVACTDCVIQWKYRGGNNWGCEGTQCGLGYGNQENFVNCADVRINSKGGSQTVNNDPKITGTKPKDQNTNTSGNKPNGNCRSVAPFVGPDMDKWCATNCAAKPPNCPATHCAC